MIVELFNPTPEHKLLRETIARFASEFLEPKAEENDRNGHFDLSLFSKLSELGMHGITVSVEDGGAGLDAVAATIVHHELSKVDPGFCLAYLAHAILFVNNFYYASNPQQRDKYLDKVVSGQWLGAMGMTEPNHGTDVLGMATTAKRVGPEYVINGSKTYITNAPHADIFLIYAKIDGKISAFIVEKEIPGVKVSAPTKKMGMRSSAMGEIYFDDCRVPIENLLGEEGGGLVHMMRNLEMERLTLSAMSLGIADRCFDIMLKFASERTAFGGPIHRFGQIQRYIADAYAMIEASRCLIYHEATKVGPNTQNRLGTDASKLFAAPVGKQVADYAMQVLGGAGYCSEYKVERFYRDAKLLEIGGGTIESHQKNITKDLIRNFRENIV